METDIKRHWLCYKFLEQSEEEEGDTWETVLDEPMWEEEEEEDFEGVTWD
jgi:hypothetical protein|tara:strand:+ start:1754 stop:1903 length:150 start_codon:yes stop_codon:yes gene_type:complete